MSTIRALRLPEDHEVISIRLEGGLFVAYVGEERIAESLSSRRLGEWGLSFGALRVRHDYDLREGQ